MGPGLDCAPSRLGRRRSRERPGARERRRADRNRRAGAAGELARGRARRHPPSPTPNPAPARYPWQWYWDSCFAAIVWRRFEPARARAELESLLAAQRPNGFIGHTIFWHRPVTLNRLPFYNVASRTSFQTETIQPPLLAWAWRIAVGDPAVEPRIARPGGLAGAPTATSRATACCGSSSPTSRGSTPRRSSTRSGAGAPTPGSASRCSCGATASSALTPAGSAIAAARSSARRWSTRCGRSRCRRSADPRPRRPWSTRLWDERRGLFLDEAQPGGARPAVITWAALAPLALPDLPEEIGRRLVEEHLLERREFLTPVAPPSVAASEPSYEPGGGRGPIRRYWRGPTWVNSAWMVWLGMRRLGYEEEARQLAAGPDRARSSAKACASTTTRATAPASAPSTSPGRR